MYRDAADADTVHDGRPHIMAEPITRGDGVLVDALPYIDDEVRTVVCLCDRDRQTTHATTTNVRVPPPKPQIDAPGMRDAVDALILAEMGSFVPPDYLADLPPPPPVPSSALLAAEVARIADSGGNRASAASAAAMAAVAAFERVPPPPPPPAGDGGATEASTAAAWESAAARLAVAHEATVLRAINVELMTRYGVEAWKVHVAGLEGMHAATKARVATLAARIEAVNGARKARQEKFSGRLAGSVRKWREAVDTNLQVELACHDADAEVRRLKRLAVDAGLLSSE